MVPSDEGSFVREIGLHHRVLQADSEHALRYGLTTGGRASPLPQRGGGSKILMARHLQYDGD